MKRAAPLAVRDRNFMMGQEKEERKQNEASVSENGGNSARRAARHALGNRSLC
jgi:hypothetical protein